MWANLYIHSLIKAFTIYQLVVTSYKNARNVAPHVSVQYPFKWCQNRDTVPFLVKRAHNHSILLIFINSFSVWISAAFYIHWISKNINYLPHILDAFAADRFWKHCGNKRNTNKRPMRAYALLALIWLVSKGTNYWQYVINIQIPSKFGEDQIVNGSSIVFTSCIIAILTISRAIIKPCMGRSGRFFRNEPNSHGYLTTV